MCQRSPRILCCLSSARRPSVRIRKRRRFSSLQTSCCLRRRKKTFSKSYSSSRSRVTSSLQRARSSIRVYSRCLRLEEMEEEKFWTGHCSAPSTTTTKSTLRRTLDRTFKGKSCPSCSRKPSRRQIGWTSSKARIGPELCSLSTATYTGPTMSSLTRTTANSSARPKHSSSNQPG